MYQDQEQNFNDAQQKWSPVKKKQNGEIEKTDIANAWGNIKEKGIEENSVGWKRGV